MNSKVMMKYFFFTLLLLLLTSSALAVENACIYYFHGKNCDGCPESGRFLEDLQQKYPSLQVQQYEVYYDPSNLNLLQQYFQAYAVPEAGQSVPVVFTSNSYFIGSNAITSLLEEHIVQDAQATCPTPEPKAVVGLVGEGAPPNVLHTLTFSAVSAGALGHAFSIAMLPLLILLLLFIVASRDQEQILKKGFLFLLGVAVTYLLFASGIFSWFLLPTPGWLFSRVLGVLAILLALPSLRRLFSSKPFIRNFPESIKKLKEKNLLSWLLLGPSLFLWGLVVSLFTLHAASPTLLVLRTLFAANIGRMVVIPMTVYYLFMFILPLLVLAFLLHALNKKLHHYSHQRGGLDRREVELWKNHNVKVFNFVLSLVIILSAVWMLIG